MPFEQKESQEQEQQQQQQQEETKGKSNYNPPFLWVSEVTLGAFGRNSDVFPSFAAMVFFPIREVPFEQKKELQEQEQQQ